MLVKCLCSAPSYISGSVHESYIHPHTIKHHFTSRLILYKKIYGMQAPHAVPQHKKQSVQVICFQFIRKEYKIAMPQKLREKDQKGDMTTGVNEGRPERIKTIRKLNSMHTYLHLIYQAMYRHVHFSQRLSILKNESCFIFKHSD